MPGAGAGASALPAAPPPRRPPPHGDPPGPGPGAAGPDPPGPGERRADVAVPRPAPAKFGGRWPGPGRTAPASGRQVATGGLRQARERETAATAVSTSSGTTSSDDRRHVRDVLERRQVLDPGRQVEDLAEDPQGAERERRPHHRRRPGRHPDTSTVSPTSTHTAGMYASATPASRTTWPTSPTRCRRPGRCRRRRPPAPGPCPPTPRPGGRPSTPPGRRVASRARPAPTTPRVRSRSGPSPCTRRRSAQHRRS